MNRMREYWEFHNITVGLLKEGNVETLGKFVQGFTLKELEQLPDSVKTIAIQKLGEYTDLPEDKLKSRAHFALKHLKVRTYCIIIWNICICFNVPHLQNHKF